MLKSPDPDPSVDTFRDGIAVLRRDGEVAGHVASAVSTFWTPAKPLSRQWWVWFVVVWSDGERERAFEDYPPWTFVSELQSGTFVWEEEGRHKGTCGAEWLTGEDREATRARLGITPEDFSAKPRPVGGMTVNRRRDGIAPPTRVTYSFPYRRSSV